jgi:hypothetical protein
MRLHALSTGMFQAAFVQGPTVGGLCLPRARCTRCDLPTKSRGASCCDWMSGVVLVVGVVVLSLPGGETEMTGQRPSEMSEICDRPKRI